MGNGNSFSDQGYGAFQNQGQSTQQYYEQRFQSLNNELVQVHKRIAELAERTAQLEKHIHYPHSLGQEVAMKEAAAQAQGNSCRIEGYRAYHADKEAQAVPMRSDVETILTLRSFVEGIATGGGNAWRVQALVNVMADEALGRKK